MFVLVMSYVYMNQVMIFIRFLLSLVMLGVCGWLLWSWTSELNHKSFNLGWLVSIVVIGMVYVYKALDNLFMPIGDVIDANPRLAII